MSGNGPRVLTFRIPDFKRRLARLASITASSCATRWCCGEGLAPPRRRTSGLPIATSFLPMCAGSSWAFGWPMATSKQLQFLANAATASAVREGLGASAKWLPAKLFYDEAGSALFEQITELPEYYLTRTERAIFESYAAEILQAAGPSLDRKSVV